MADTINSLFGITPEALMMQRENAMRQQALQYAQLDPMQQAQMGMYMAGSRLGEGIGGLLGGQDPELAKATALQRIMNQADTTTPEGLSTLARTLAGQGFGQQAFQVAQQAQGMKKTYSEITKNLRERAAADPLQQLIRAGKYTTDSVAKYSETENIRDLVPIDKEDPTALSETKEGIFLISKKTGEKIARIGDSPERGTKVNVAPEIKMTDKELDWRKQFLTENKPLIDQASNIRQSLNLLDQGTPFASAAFGNTVVSALGGDKQKSNAEIKRLANTGALDTRIANTLTNFFEGKQTATTVADQRVVLNALDEAIKARYASSSNAWTKRLNQAKVDSTLVVPSYEEVVGNKSSAGGSATYKGIPAKIIAQNPDGSVVIEQNGIQKTLAPKKK